MEDAATVEISRMQVWQWVHHRATTADGIPVTAELVRGLLDEEVERLSRNADEPVKAQVAAARTVFEAAALAEQWPQFFTNLAYDSYLVAAS